jgi:hypothetical protein
MLPRAHKRENKFDTTAIRHYEATTTMSPAEMFDPIWWLRAWTIDDWLRSKRAARYFIFCIVATLALTIYMYTASYVLYSADLHGYVYWTVEIAVDSLVAAGVIGQLTLWLGMWRYWVRLDNSDQGTKKIWFVVLLFGLWFGAIVYFFAIYRRQLAMSGTERGSHLEQV